MWSLSTRRHSLASRRGTLWVGPEEVMQLPSSPSRRRHATRSDSEHISLSPSSRFPRPATPIQPRFSEAAETSLIKGLRPSLRLQRKDIALHSKQRKTEGLEIAGRNPRFTLGTDSSPPPLVPLLALQRFPERRVRLKRYQGYK